MTKEPEEVFIETASYARIEERMDIIERNRFKKENEKGAWPEYCKLRQFTGKNGKRPDSDGDHRREARRRARDRRRA